MSSRLAAATNTEISQLIKQAVEFIIKTGEKVFCLQLQIKLKSCINLLSWRVHKKA